MTVKAKKYKCRDCVHMFRHEFNNSMCYCNVQINNRTSYRRKRVSPISDVCNYFAFKNF